MNTQAFWATLLATLGATLALASERAWAVKPTPQPSPCVGAESRGFPALVFTRKRTTGGHVYYDTILSDASGQCHRTVYVADGFAPSFPASDVNLRYDATEREGLIVRGGGAPGLTIAASRYTVSFDGSGVPSVTPEPSYSTVLALADLATPADLGADGWSKYVLANPRISPDGTQMLVTVLFRKIQGTVETVRNTFWTCPFDTSQQPPVTAASCAIVHRGQPGDTPSTGWGGRSDSLYITAAASTSGSSRSLYRLELPTQTLTEIWNIGTMFSGVRGSLDAFGRELAAVYEAAASGCSRVVVINAGLCAANSCPILNGAGSPARTMTWLPDGRVAGEGQAAPNRKGQCSASGSLVVFDADDPNGTTTTITPAGSYPDGAGGG